jgi:hypothetical protein
MAPPFLGFQQRGTGCKLSGGAQKSYEHQFSIQELERRFIPRGVGESEIV